jgi:hypothetical protein
LPAKSGFSLNFKLRLAAMQYWFSKSKRKSDGAVVVCQHIEASSVCEARRDLGRQSKVLADQMHGSEELISARYRRAGIASAIAVSSRHSLGVRSLTSLDVFPVSPSP